MGSKSLIIKGSALLSTRFYNISVCHRGLALSSSLTNPKTTTDEFKKFTPADPKTHTGQKFSEDDYKMVRFLDKEKQVNSRFAIDLIKEEKPNKEKSRIVSCDGGGGPTGHPKVYINLDSPGNHSCGYCGLRFYKDNHHH